MKKFITLLLALLLCLALAAPAFADATGEIPPANDALAGNIENPADAEPPADLPTDEPIDTPVDIPTDAPVDTPVDEPTDTPADVPTDEPVDEPAQNIPQAVLEPIRVERVDPIKNWITEPINTYSIPVYVGGVLLTGDMPGMSIDQRTLVPVRFVSDYLGAKTVWDKETNTVKITAANGTEIILIFDETYAIVNGVEKALPDNVSVELIGYKGANRTMVPLRFVSEQLGAEAVWDSPTKTVQITPPAEAPEPEPIWEDWAYVNPVLVVLDPGHGGKDPGAVYDVYEKTINLSVAQKTAAILSEYGINVILTREDDDTYLALPDRPAVAQTNQATLFVSLHCNASESKSLTGIETYVQKGNEKAYNEDLAAALSAAVHESTGTKNRGVKHANLSVLRNSVTPAALIEMGFLSNKDENAYMITDEYQQKLAVGVANGIIAFLDQYHFSY